MVSRFSGHTKIDIFTHLSILCTSGIVFNLQFIIISEPTPCFTRQPLYKERNKKRATKGVCGQKHHQKKKKQTAVRTSDHGPSSGNGHFGTPVGVPIQVGTFFGQTAVCGDDGTTVLSNGSQIGVLVQTDSVRQGVHKGGVHVHEVGEASTSNQFVDNTDEMFELVNDVEFVNIDPHAEVVDIGHIDQIVDSDQENDHEAIDNIADGASDLNENTDGENTADFNWTMYGNGDLHNANWLQPYSRRRGVLVDTEGFQPVDFFKVFFPNALFEQIAEQTNLYASQYFEAEPNLAPKSRFHAWRECSADELHGYIALQLAMGLVNKPAINDYWSCHWLFSTPGFKEVMQRDRFELITSFLHFNDNNLYIPRGEEGYDPLYKIRPLLDIVEPLYLNSYVPGCELAIDESMIKFKGRIHFKQYLPSKPTRWGIKVYALCESKTGFLLKFIVYTGKNTFPRDPQLLLSEQVVSSLLHGFSDFNHIVYMDNFYSSPNLFRQLVTRNIGAVGTVKHSRKNMPPQLLPRNLHLAKGDDPVFMKDDPLVVVTWHDTKRVAALSTIHTNMVTGEVLILGISSYMYVVFVQFYFPSSFEN